MTATRKQFLRTTFLKPKNTFFRTNVELDQAEFEMVTSNTAFVSKNAFRKRHKDAVCNKYTKTTNSYREIYAIKRNCENYAENLCN